MLVSRHQGCVAPARVAPQWVTEMLEVLGNRQQELMKLLLQNKSGMTVDELSERLEITRNAVRQHVSALENHGLITQGGTRPSGGRPEQLYVLTETGKESFPRNYPWLAQLLLESIKEQDGTEGLKDRLGTMGSAVARELRGQHPGLESRQQKVEKLAELLKQFGYEARSTAASAPTIEASNCIFHSLAVRNPEVCQFDLALLSTFTDSKVDHQECMARGGNVCRFKFVPRR